jgi:uncharacterized Fe-S cluster protein YjdI
MIRSHSVRLLVFDSLACPKTNPKSTNSVLNQVHADGVPSHLPNHRQTSSVGERLPSLGLPASLVSVHNSPCLPGGPAVLNLKSHPQTKPDERERENADPECTSKKVHKSCPLEYCVLPRRPFLSKAQLPVSSWRFNLASRKVYGTRKRRQVSRGGRRRSERRPRAPSPRAAPARPLPA